MSGGTLAVAVALLSACSSGVSQGTSAELPSTGVSQSRGNVDLAHSGVAPKFLGMLRHGHAPKQHGVRPATCCNAHNLFVTDFSTGVVNVLKYRRWTDLDGPISNGTNGPDGDWVDKANKDLYVANYSGPTVTEYDENGNLLYTYSTGMADPVDGTTDKHGNVFVADYNYNTSGIPGSVNEYAHMSNTVVASCSPGNVEGVAVDKHGNVFAAYNNISTLVGSIIEYHAPFSSCSGTVLPITFGYLGGIALDKQGNLVVCDQTGANFSGGVVDVIAANGGTYPSVTGTLGSGYSDPFHVTIDMAGTQAYVADLGAAVVQVLSYPAGSNVATLGSANGLTQPASAVDTHNLVVDNQGP